MAFDACELFENTGGFHQPESFCHILPQGF
jgi:hypothetical protein